MTRHIVKEHGNISSSVKTVSLKRHSRAARHWSSEWTELQDRRVLKTLHKTVNVTIVQGVQSSRGSVVIVMNRHNVTMAGMFLNISGRLRVGNWPKLLQRTRKTSIFQQVHPSLQTKK